MNQWAVNFSLTFLAALIFLAGGCGPKEKNEFPSPPTNETPLSHQTNSSRNSGVAETYSTSPLPGISGKITLQGSPPPERSLPLDAVCGKLNPAAPKTRFFVVGKDGELADVFVYIKSGLTGSVPPPGPPVLLDQVGCEYTPYVIGLQTKQKLLVRNSDPIIHNVHPTPKVSGNHESNKAQMSKSPDFEYSFENPEVFVTYRCDIHPWMYAYVGVVEHPFFAVSSADGKFHLKSVPPGKYVVAAFHRKGGSQTKEITIAQGEGKTLDFVFEIPGAQ